MCPKLVTGCVGREQRTDDHERERSWSLYWQREVGQVIEDGDK